MNIDNCDKMLEEFGLSDCFIEAEEKLEITPEQILELRMQIDEKVTKNQDMLNTGIALLALNEKFERGEISNKTYRKVMKELSRKH